MTWKHTVLFAATICLGPAWLLGADGQQPATPESEVAQEADVLFPGRSPDYYESPQWVTRGQSPGYGSARIVRFGWWGVDTDGSLSGVGEWWGLEPSSPFWDVDGLASDGQRTLDYSLTGTEDEMLNVRTHYFGPNLTADVDLQRYIHRLGFKPLDAWFNTPDSPIFYADDFTETTDNAIRVQQLDAQFKGHLTKNITWGLNVWGMRKFGERQTISMDHGCTRAITDPRGRACHQVTQTQSIDWLTMEIEPVLEAKFGPVTAKYRRTMRAFEQSDGVVTRSYGGTGFPNEFIDPSLEYPYAVVSENYTQVDRLQVGVDVTRNTRFYSNLYVGDTENRNRNTNRGFWGADLRLINRTFEDVTLTGFAKKHEMWGQFPPTFPEDDLFPEGSKPSEEVRHPVDRQRDSIGFDSRWTPFGRGSTLRGLAFRGGYEYRELNRQFVTYEIMGSPDAPDPVVFTQPNTISNLMHVGADWRMSSALDTFLRYKMVNNELPLFGVREADEATGDPALPAESDISALNSNQPRHVDRIEFGGTWTPMYNFLFSAKLGIEQRNHVSDGANFQEEDYPLIFTAWYAPTPKWSFSGGLAFYSNWIDQDITFGNLHGSEPQDTQPVAYGGRANVVNFGTRYCCTPRLIFVGEFEFVRGQNLWTVPTPADPVDRDADWSGLPGYSAVIVETTRFSTGWDWLISERVSSYFRYIYYDYGDETNDFNSGTAHMFLAGVSATH
jgi:hypothetical protein